jgi:hypothetical protein
VIARHGVQAVLMTVTLGCSAEVWENDLGYIEQRKSNRGLSTNGAKVAEPTNPSYRQTNLPNREILSCFTRVYRCTYW